MLGLLAFTSCVDDEGNNNMSDVNEAKIEGIEDSYYKVADVENLEIPVKVTGTLSGDDLNSFDYMWYPALTYVDSICMATRPTAP